MSIKKLNENEIVVKLNKKILRLFDDEMFILYSPLPSFPNRVVLYDKVNGYDKQVMEFKLRFDLSPTEKLKQVLKVIVKYKQKVAYQLGQDEVKRRVESIL